MTTTEVVLGDGELVRRPFEGDLVGGDLAVPAMPQCGDIGERLCLGDTGQVRADRWHRDRRRRRRRCGDRRVQFRPRRPRHRGRRSPRRGEYRRLLDERVPEPDRAALAALATGPTVGAGCGLGDQLRFTDPRVARVGDDHDELGVVAVRAAFPDGTGARPRHVIRTGPSMRSAAMRTVRGPVSLLKASALVTVNRSAPRLRLRSGTPSIVIRRAKTRSVLHRRVEVGVRAARAVGDGQVRRGGS